jgi:hypothetical protein
VPVRRGRDDAGLGSWGAEQTHGSEDESDAEAVPAPAARRAARRIAEPEPEPAAEATDAVADEPPKRSKKDKKAKKTKKSRDDNDGDEAAAEAAAEAEPRMSSREAEELVRSLSAGGWKVMRGREGGRALSMSMRLAHTVREGKR